MGMLRGFYQQGLYDEKVNPPRSAAFRRTLNLFIRDKCQNLLDIGCGDGTYTKLIQEYIGAKNAYGVDIDSRRLEQAKIKGIFVQITDLNQNILGFKSESFDCIYCSEVIEHLFSPDILLENIYRLLTPKGYAIITTPNLASWRNRIALLIGWQPFWSEVRTKIVIGNPRCSGLPSGHIRLFTPLAIKEIVNLNNFQFDAMIGVTYLQHIAPSDPISWVSDHIDHLILKMLPNLCDGFALRIRRKR